MMAARPFATSTSGQGNPWSKSISEARNFNQIFFLKIKTQQKKWATSALHVCRHFGTGNVFYVFLIWGQCYNHFLSIFTDFRCCASCAVNFYNAGVVTQGRRIGSWYKNLSLDRIHKWLDIKRKEPFGKLSIVMTGIAPVFREILFIFSKFFSSQMMIAEAHFTT
jgi:hypothetical protein